jgi:hypothetical protein
MCHTPASVWGETLPAIFGFIGTIVGALITYFGMEKVRTRKSIYDVADLFAQEAAVWAEFMRLTFSFFVTSIGLMQLRCFRATMEQALL